MALIYAATRQKAFIFCGSSVVFIGRSSDKKLTAERDLIKSVVHENSGQFLEQYASKELLFFIFTSQVNQIRVYIHKFSETIIDQIQLFYEFKY